MDKNIKPCLTKKIRLQPFQTILNPKALSMSLFVHYSCAKASLGSTLENFQTERDVLDRTIKGEDTHQLGVVGIMFDIVEADNPAFDSLFSVFEDIKYPPKSGDASHVVKDLDLSGLIPADVGSRGYYAYEGSLTTPH